MGTRRHYSSVTCEVCTDRIKHFPPAIVVGRKVNRQNRVIHDSPGCRKKWRESGDEITARWPENRAAQHKPSAVIVALEAAPAPVAQEANPMPQEAPLQTTTATDTRRSPRPHFKPKLELEEFVRQYLSRAGGFRRGMTTSITAVLRHSSPDLLLDLNDKAITDSALYSIIRRVQHEIELAEARRGAVQPVLALHPEPGSDKPVNVNVHREHAARIAALESKVAIQNLESSNIAKALSELEEVHKMLIYLVGTGDLIGLESVAEAARAATSGRD